jgi:hypothetical protein
MTDMELIYGFTAVILLGGIIRLLTQGLLFSRKMGRSFKEGIIPFYTNIQLHNNMGVKNLNITGMAFRIIGFLILAGTVLHQTYHNLVQMTHAYGILLGYYTPVDYSEIWNVLSTIGASCILVGFSLRLFTIRRFNMFFSGDGILSLIGMFAPSVYYMILALSKKYVYLPNKPVDQMSREEYQMYCAMSNE